jgi:hypothetical protein
MGGTGGFHNLPRLARAESYPSTVTQAIVMRLGEDMVLIISQIHRDAVDRHDSIATIGKGHLIGIERRSARRYLGLTVYYALVREAACA